MDDHFNILEELYEKEWFVNIYHPLLVKHYPHQVEDASHWYVYNVLSGCGQLDTLSAALDRYPVDWFDWNL